MGFEAAWLAARGPFDDAALDLAIIQEIRVWGAALPPERVPIVVDLGSGTGAALARVRRWLAPRPILAYAVDRDAELLTRAAASSPAGCAEPTSRSGGPPSQTVIPLQGDLLEPIQSLGGPADGTVDLVVGHALADLLPLDRLAGRVAALVRPGGLVHLALAYDGLTSFAQPPDPERAGFDGLPEVEAEVIAAFHRHMDCPRADCPSYGGSTAGRRLGPALETAGLELLADAPSVWHIAASDGEPGVSVLARLLRFIVEAAREVGAVPSDDLEGWASRRQAALARRTLTARVGHRDVLARAPIR